MRKFHYKLYSHLDERVGMVFSYFNSSDIFTNSAKAFIKSGQPNMVLV